MYNIEFINLFIFHYRNGLSIFDISKFLMVSLNTLYRWIHLYDFEIQNNIIITQEVFNSKKKPNKSKKIHLYYKKVENYVNENLGCQLNDIKKHIKNDLSCSSICRILKELKLTRKRFKTHSYCKDISNIKEDRKTFSKQLINQNKFHDFISIDESSFCINDYYKYGYSKKGMEIKKYWKHKKNQERYSLLCAINHDSIVDYQISKGSFNGSMYFNFLKKNNHHFKDKIILQDNARIHHCREIKEWSQVNNITLNFIPAYSPEFNPIELVFSKIKSFYRKMDHLNMEDDIKKSIKSVKSEDIKNCYNHTYKEIQKYNF